MQRGVCAPSTGRKWEFGPAGAWLGLLITGQAAALSLVDAGTRLHYQHFAPWSALVETSPAAVTVLAAQVLLVAVGLARRRHALVTWCGRSFGKAGASMIVAAFVLLSATVSADGSRYAGELVLATLVQAVALGNVVLVVTAVPESAAEGLSIRLSYLLGAEAENSRPQADRFSIACALAVTAAAAVLCVAVYERHPHVQDEVKYLYQARYYAAGMLAMPAPPVPEAFEMFLLEVGPRGWFSVIPPGWAMVLALGQLAGAVWLVNPALAGLNVLLAYTLLWRLYDRRTARLSLLLLCASPWYLFLGMSFMPHMVTLTCLLISALGVLKARDTGSWAPAAAGGAAVGFLSLVRQLDGFVVAVVLGLWAVGVGGRRLRPTGIVALAAGTALVAGLTLPYNWYFTGQATKFPIMAHTDRLFGENANAYGFGADRGMGWAIDPFPGHGLRDALVNTNLNATVTNVELFGWASGSLLFVYFLVFAKGLRGSDWLMAALALAVFVAYFFNYFSGGPDFGARYWFLMILPGVALTARGIGAVDEATGDRGVAGSRGTVAALVLSAIALVVFVPWRAVDKYYHYLDMRPDIVKLAGDAGFGRSLVLIRGPEFPDYASAAAHNPIDLDSDAPIYARDLGPEVRARLREAFGDRPVWMVEGPTVTGDGYRITGGPNMSVDPSKEAQ